MDGDYPAAALRHSSVTVASLISVFRAHTTTPVAVKVRYSSEAEKQGFTSSFLSIEVTTDYSENVSTQRSVKK